MIPDGTVADQYNSIFCSSDARSGGFLAVPLRAVRECKSCAQSLSGLLAVLRLDGGKITYRSQAELSKSAAVPLRTWQRHAAELQRLGIIRTASSPNESNSTELTTPPAEWFADGFVPVPKWLLASELDLTWSERVVYAWTVYRSELSPDQTWHEDSLAQMATALGLTRRTIINAIRGLVAAGLIDRDLIPGSAATTRLKSPVLAGEKVAGRWGKSGGTGGEKVAGPTIHKNLLVRTGQNRKPPDQELTVESGPVPRMANTLFAKSGYSGDDGAILWTVAGLVVAGLVTEHEAIDAANGANECNANNRPAYFRAILQRHLTRRGADLNELTGRIRLTPTTPSDRPIRASQRPSVAVRMKSPADA